MFRKKEPSYKAGVILYQTHADEVPEPSRKVYRPIKYIKHQYIFCPKCEQRQQEKFAESGIEAGAPAGPV